MKAFVTALVSLSTAALVLASSESASAMNYNYRVYKKQIVINASGDIELDEAKTFSGWLKNVAPRWKGRNPTAIIFDSLGGNTFGAFDLGNVIAHDRLTTGVGHGGVCASSCVLAWASGGGMHEVSRIRTERSMPGGNG
jgi:hypothetical protein